MSFKQIRDEMALAAYAKRLPTLITRESELRCAILDARKTMTKTAYEDAQRDKQGYWYELQYVTAQIEGIRRDSLRRKRGMYRRLKRHIVAVRLAPKSA